MKSDKEFTANVLNKAEKYKKEKRRTKTAIIKTGIAATVTIVTFLSVSYFKRNNRISKI